MTKMPQTQLKIAIVLTACASLFFLVRLVQIITSDDDLGTPGLTAGIASQVYVPVTVGSVRLAGCLVLLVILLMRLRQQRK